MSFRKSASVLRIAVGFVAGSTIGWAAHDNRHKIGRVFNGWSWDGDDRQTVKVCPWVDIDATKFKPSCLWDDNWDRRDPTFLHESKKKHKQSSTNSNKDGSSETNIEKPTARRHLFLIRHGQYNVDGATDSTRTLTALGLQQAELTGQRLRDLEFPYFTLIHSSMTRARQTADAIRQFLPDVAIMECDLLREGAPCEPEPPFRHWKPDFKDGARIEAAFRKYFHRADVSQKEDSYEILVCHANVIRYFVCRALQLPPEAWLRISLSHGSVTCVTIAPSGRVALRSLGDAGFMPPKKVTTV